MILIPSNDDFFRHKAQTAMILALVSALLLATASCGRSATVAATPSSASSSQTQASLKPVDSETGKAQVVKVTADAALNLMKDNSATVLLDVRTADEYAQGHIAKSQLLPVEELASRTDELPKDKATPIIVYCRSGRRSAIAAAQLVEMGYTQVSDLGGIQDWPYDIVK